LRGRRLFCDLLYSGFIYAHMTDPRYPIGKFSNDGPPTPEQKKKMLKNIEQTPAQLRAAIAGLSEAQLDTPYRDGGWTVRQLAHHVPDSHMNAYIRFKIPRSSPTSRIAGQR